MRACARVCVVMFFVVFCVGVSTGPRRRPKSTLGTQSSICSSPSIFQYFVRRTRLLQNQIRLCTAKVGFYSDRSRWVFTGTHCRRQHCSKNLHGLPLLPQKNGSEQQVLALSANHQVPKPPTSFSPNGQGYRSVVVCATVVLMDASTTHKNLIRVGSVPLS